VLIILSSQKVAIPNRQPSREERICSGAFEKGANIRTSDYKLQHVKPPENLVMILTTVPLDSWAISELVMKNSLYVPTDYEIAL
jgi:hypothetical protein